MMADQEFIVEMTDGRCHWNILVWAADEETAGEIAYQRENAKDRDPCSVQHVWPL